MPPTHKLLLGSTACAYLISLFAPSLAIRQSVTWTASSIFLAGMLSWLIWAVLLYPNFFSPLRHLPMPPGRTLFMGHSARLLKDPSGAPMRDWVNEVPNDGLIRYLHAFNRERVFVTSAKGLSEVLVTKVYDFEKPSAFRAGRQRKDLNPAFAFRHVKDLYPTFWSKSVELVERLSHDIAHRPSDYDHDFNVVQATDYTSRATLDIIGLAGMGQDFGTLADPTNKLNSVYRIISQPDRFTKYIGIASAILGPWLIRKLPIKRNRQIAEAIAYIREVCHELIEHKRAQTSRTDHDIISVALESGGFDDEGMINQMMTFLVAGHETTATALTWALFELCKAPEVQRRLRREIHDHLPSPRTEAGRHLTAHDLDALPFLSAVCNEVLRLRPPVSVTIRNTARDTSILGQRVPKGTAVVLSAWATNNDFALWGPDAREFNPDRYLTKSSSSSAADGGKGGAAAAAETTNYRFLTFIHGPRSCIGERFARGEFACLLAAWIGRFEVEFERPDHELEISSGATLRPKGGLWLRLREVEDW